MTKTTDTRREAHIAQYGDISVELDTLTPPILRARINESIRAHINLDLFAEGKRIERAEKEKFRFVGKKLQAALKGL